MMKREARMEELEARFADFLARIRSGARLSEFPDAEELKELRRMLRDAEAGKVAH